MTLFRIYMASIWTFMVTAALVVVFPEYIFIQYVSIALGALAYVLCMIAFFKELFKSNKQ
jgi:hypothetical protein